MNLIKKISHRKKTITLSLFLLFTQKSIALPESELTPRNINKIHRYWKSGIRRDFKGVNGANIATYTFSKGPLAPAFVIVPGRTEASFDYAELLYDLRNEKYSFYLIDHRGQGNSDRLTSEHDLGHVDRFHDYVDDLKTFVDTLVNPKGNKKVYFYAHSMGANIATHLLNENPEMGRALVITSPMFKINTGKIPKVVGQLLAFYKVIAGKAASFALGKKKWTEEDEVFENNISSGSKIRYETVFNIYKNHPKLRVGGPSYGWVLEAFRSGSEILRIKKKSFQTPTLLITGGSDKVIFPKVARNFCSTLAETCYERNFPESLHSMILERDSIRTTTIKDTLNFFRIYE